MSAPTTFQELLDDEVLDIGDGYRAKNSELTGGGEIFLRAGHVTDTHIDFEGVERFDPALSEKVESKMSEVGDTIITTKGNSTGRTSFVTSDMPRFVYSPHLCYWRSTDPERIENGFLRYWARGKEFQHQLAALKASTDMAPYLSLKDQKRLKITLPPIEEQRAIASILGALDDKIELNRRMNATLESLARAIFKSWFVDFDPVHVNAGKINAGQMPASSAIPTTHDPKVLDLFPSTFQDSELGPIPEGWGSTTLGDEVDFQTGNAFKSKSFTNEPPGTRLARGMNVKEGVFFWGNQTRYWPEVTEDIEPYLLRAGDVLIGMDGSKVGKNWVRVREVDLPCLLVQRVARLRAADSVGENFLWIFCGSETFRRYVDSVKTGTSIPHISGGQIKSLSFVRPPKGDDRVFHEFENIVSAFASQQSARQECK
ncbi:restriction endonuclease subunit S [Rhodopirellula baltica]|uniref:Type I restriction system specificity protein n=1 Tax=Rhodopirellula baltica SWK14 TaxID=993516 RepID=L7CHY6_RHOBT|nr:restriction endonuclease subunit S [Rhodopirellula baltica]ELP32686.1 type I restriction system specificity protein [Rhodopirellula baltica SWK14]